MEMRTRRLKNGRSDDGRSFWKKVGDAEMYTNDTCDAEKTIRIDREVSANHYTKLTDLKSVKRVLFHSVSEKHVISAPLPRGTVHVLSMKHDPRAANIYTDDSLRDAGIDSGAEISVIGEHQVNEYQHMMDMRQKLATSSLEFKFWN